MRIATTGALLAMLIAAACAGPAPKADGGDVRTDVIAELDRLVARVRAVSAAHDSILQPLPLLTPAQESDLRRYLNAAQLARARELGVDRPDSAGVAAMLERGALIPIDRESPYWVVSELDASRAFVTPDAHEMLEALGQRFHDRLAALGLPGYRFEISSALRTAESQRRLRSSNPNAAAGVSTHEFGTTVDVLYSRFAAPRDLSPWVADGLGADLAPHAQAIAALAGDRVGGRRALELKAILGETLIALQRDGAVMVTLEQRQPVFHMTVARRY